MDVLECIWEDRIRRAARGGLWDDDLRTHVDECGTCADVALVSEAMHAESVTGTSGTTLPEPGRVWWRARLLARREAEARATRPIAVWERFAAATGLVAGASVAWRFWPRAAASAAELQQTFALEGTLGLGTTAVSVAMAAATLLAFLIWFALGHHPRRRVHPLKRPGTLRTPACAPRSAGRLPVGNH